MFTSPGGPPPKTGLPGSGALGPSGPASKRPPGPRRAFCQAFPAHIDHGGHRRSPRDPQDSTRALQE
eukprot:9060475-Pyramimonas_sp.AAC.1